MWIAPDAEPSTDVTKNIGSILIINGANKIVIFAKKVGQDGKELSGTTGSDPQRSIIFFIVPSRGTIVINRQPIAILWATKEAKSSVP